MKTVIAKNKNLTEGLGAKVKKFSEKVEPGVKMMENRSEEKTRNWGICAERPISK